MLAYLFLEAPRRITLLDLDPEKLPTFAQVPPLNWGISFYQQNPNTKMVHTSITVPIQKYPMYLGR